MIKGFISNAEKCSMYCTNYAVITQGFSDIASRASFSMSFDIVKRKHKPLEVISNKEGLK